MNTITTAQFEELLEEQKSDISKLTELEVKIIYTATNTTGNRIRRIVGFGVKRWF